MFVELDTRHGDGVTVTLEWDRDTGHTQIVVHDMRSDGLIAFRVPPVSAADALAALETEHEEPQRVRNHAAALADAVLAGGPPHECYMISQDLYLRMNRADAIARA